MRLIATSRTFLLATTCSLALLLSGIGARSAQAQSAREREEKAQSQPKRSESNNNESKSDNYRNETSYAYPVAVPVIVGGGGGGSYPVSVSAPVYGGARYGNFPRIAFLSDRSGVPGAWVMYENGSDIRRITRPEDAAHDVAFSPDRGRIACVVSSPGGEAGHILLVNANGKSPKKLNIDTSARQLAWSPDDRSIVYTSDRTGNEEIYIATADGKSVRRLTEHPAHDHDPAFSGNGAFIYFASDRDGKSAIYRLHTDGTGTVERVTPPDAPAASSPACTGWNNLIAFVGQDAQDARRSDIYLYNPTIKQFSQLTHDAGQNLHPTWDPAGGRLAFSSNRGGTFSIYTIPEKGGDVRQITFGPGNDTHPSWW